MIKHNIYRDNSKEKHESWMYISHDVKRFHTINIVPFFHHQGKKNFILDDRVAYRETSKQCTTEK